MVGEERDQQHDGRERERHDGERDARLRAQLVVGEQQQQMGGGDE